MGAKAKDKASKDKGGKESERKPEFSRGDWIVHAQYGVGQIKKIEKKRVHGEKVRCYRVRTEQSTFWIPLESEIDGRMRPMISEGEFKDVIKAIKKPPKEMADNHRKRKKRIREVMSDLSLVSTAKLIRDLWGRKNRDRLNDTEERAFRKLTDRLLREWAISQEISEKEAQKELYGLLGEDDPKGS